jgi:3-dehydroquinate dehydratase
MQVEEERKTRPRRDTEATEATAVESEHEFDSLPTKASVDEMLEDMMHSYKGRGTS